MEQLLKYYAKRTTRTSCWWFTFAVTETGVCLAPSEQQVKQQNDELTTSPPPNDGTVGHHCQYDLTQQPAHAVVVRYDLSVIRTTPMTGHVNQATH